MSYLKNEINKNFLNNNKIKIKDELVFLINTLNSVIKSYYSITKQIIFQSKETIKNQKDLIYINNIEKQLHIFIQNAKEIFSKMKHAKKQNIINQDNNQNQLYNYSNNNFFYYSNAPTYENTQFFNRIPNDIYDKKISFKSPKTSSNINLNNFNYNSNNNSDKNLLKSKSPKNIQTKNKNNIKSPSPKYIQTKNNNNNNKNELITESNIKTNKNYSSYKILVPPKKMNFKKITNKDEILKNLLSLLKQLKIFKGKVFFETKEAQNYKKIFYLILEEIHKLIEILTKEKSKEYKCLSARNIPVNENIKKILNKKENNNHLNINRLTDLHKTFNHINKHNMIIELNKRMKSSKSQHNLKNINKSIDEQSVILNTKNNESKELKNINNKTEYENKLNSISLRNILFKEHQNNKNEKIIPEKKIKLYVDKEQQFENLYPNIIIKEKELFIENGINPKILKNEKTIKDLENKIQTMKNHIISLKQDISNSNNQLQFFKIENDKQNRQINDMTKEIILLKQLIKSYDKKNEINKKIDKKSGAKISQFEELEADKDKISIKYELLKIEYDKIKLDLEEKEKLLENYNLYTNTKESKNIDEKISNLIKKHKSEIEELNNKYTKDIINLKINLPNCFSQNTHEILIDKKYKKYDLHWYLLTIISAKYKDYENTFWVSENEIKDSLRLFNEFKTEEDIEKENMESYYITQQKLLQKIENNEIKIVKLQTELEKYKKNYE